MKRLLYVVAPMVAVFIGVVVWPSVWSSVSAREPEQPRPLILRTAEYHAKLIDCHDGDTCTFQVYYGFGQSGTYDFRLCDVYAPELKEARGEEARTVVKQMLNTGPIKLRVAQKSSCQDANRCEQRAQNRYLAYWIAGDIDVGGSMVKIGLARWARGSEPVCGRKR